MTRSSSATYFSGCYAVCMVLVAQFIDTSLWGTPAAVLFGCLLTVTLPIWFLGPAVMLWSASRLPALVERLWIRRLLTGLAFIASVFASLFLLADRHLFELYGFHINGFVLNLLVTPGGIDSLGASPASYWLAVAIAISIFALHGFWLWIASHNTLSMPMRRASVMALVVGLVSLVLGEKAIYAVGDATINGAVLQQAARVPLYVPVVAKRFLGGLGVRVAKRSSVSVGDAPSKLRYPDHRLESRPPSEPPNIVWLVAESLRWDMLTPEIMPNTTQLAAQSINLKNHFSGGNGTRQGIFSLFYGLYGSYWDSFLQASQGPVFLQHLIQGGYDLSLYTSATFTYPEFDRTVFAEVPPEAMQPLIRSRVAWQRDDRNTSRIVDYIEHHSGSKPFMLYMFYESTHARYDFPPESVIVRPYFDDLNYMTMSRGKLQARIGELKNRYINASHFVDQQMGRVFEALKHSGLSDNTIIMVTGDHGEEFMENGFWGHNSGFSDWQVRVPMVLHLPGVAPTEVTATTTHMDVVPTLAPFIGLAGSVGDFSQGLPLDDMVGRKTIVISDWAGIAMVDDMYKFTIPLHADLASQNHLFTRDDKEINGLTGYLAGHRDELADVLRNTRRFYAR